VEREQRTRLFLDDFVVPAPAPGSLVLPGTGLAGLVVLTVLRRSVRRAPAPPE